jgi:hypothetical protein
MTAREMAWKIGMTGVDDVVLFRRDGSADWLPLEGNKEQIQQLIAMESAAECAPPSPPKLKLKKRGETSAADPAETPPPFPTGPSAPPLGLETPPPPPGASGGVSLPPLIEYTDNNPPPPPGFHGYPANTHAPNTFVPPAPQLNAIGSGQASAPMTPPAPAAPPVRISTLLVASLVITFSLVGYIFFLMEQDVAGSARRQGETSSSREVKGLRYTVLTKPKALEWKETAKAKLAAFADKAKTEAAASGGRSMNTAVKAEEISAKYIAAARSLYFTCSNAKYLSISFDEKSSKDINALRKLELAMESAGAYLPAGSRTDLEAGRYDDLAKAVKSSGYESLAAAFEDEIRSVESQLKEELELIRPIADDAAGFARNTMFVVPPEIAHSAVGSSDALGLFDLKLSPGDYVLIGTTETASDTPPTAWAQGFKVKPLEENTLKLHEGNLGSTGSDSLWKPEETRGIERDILSIKRQAERISVALKSLQTLRTTIMQSKEAMERLMEK